MNLVHPRSATTFCVLHLAFCLGALAEPLAIDRYTIDGGGGRSEGGAYTVRVTIGQPDATVTSISGGTITITGGFWSQATYELFTLELLLQDLISLVNESDMRQKRPLLASLEAALASIERDNCLSATGQLNAFQNKVRRQLPDANLALAFVESAGQVIAALGCDGSQRFAARIHSLKRHPNGKVQIKLSGSAGKAYVVEASTNLVDWEAVGTATIQTDGLFEFEDPDAAKHQSRFYRVAER